jgi:dipeptidyl aminopeptidase/acylaminoacyl peptidase
MPPLYDGEQRRHRRRALPAPDDACIDKVKESAYPAMHRVLYRPRLATMQRRDGSAMRGDEMHVNDLGRRWLLGLASAAATSAVAAPPPIEDFLRPPQVGEVALSPAGTHLAMTVRGQKGFLQLAVMPLDAPEKGKVIDSFSDGNVEEVRWVNESRLVYGASNPNVPGYQPGASGLFAIDRDGTQRRHLVTHRKNFVASRSSALIEARTLEWQFDYHAPVHDGSPDIVISEKQFDGIGDIAGRLLWRLDTVTQQKRSLGAGAPAGTRGWLLDAKSEPRVLTSLRDGRATLHWRPAPDQPWQAVAEFDAYGEGTLSPWFVDATDQIYVRTARGRDTAALFRFDPQTKRLEEQPHVSLQGFDMNGRIEYDAATRRALGVHYTMERGGTHWFDKDLLTAQKAVDQALPGRVNRLDCGDCRSDWRYLVVTSGSDRQPGEYYLFDRRGPSLRLIDAHMPWLKETTQGTRSFHRVAARDGLSLPVYVTRPAGASAGTKLPTVVLVHGGPWMRGHSLAWDEEAQLLASRGWVVLEVEYRGSTGYGTKHFVSSWKEWGKAMQDDLADAVAWASKEGLTDDKRVCIMGGSYGGYAALMNPIRYPDLYRCAVSYAAVTDIELKYTVHWSDTPEEWRQHGMPRLIGDLKADAELLREASPIQQVSRLKTPVLLVHGVEDVRVPIEHANRFRAAAERAGVKVEWVSYPGEGHGWRSPAIKLDFWKRVVAFLGKHLDEPR